MYRSEHGIWELTRSNAADGLPVLAHTHRAPATAPTDVPVAIPSCTAGGVKDPDPQCERSREQRAPCSASREPKCRRLRLAGPCKLDMVLYTEEVPSAARSAFYPVNSMRNLALKQARTEVRGPTATAPLWRAPLLSPVHARVLVPPRTAIARHSRSIDAIGGCCYAAGRFLYAFYEEVCLSPGSKC